MVDRRLGAAVGGIGARLADWGSTGRLAAVFDSAGGSPYGGEQFRTGSPYQGNQFQVGSPYSGNWSTGSAYGGGSAFSVTNPYQGGSGFRAGGATWQQISQQAEARREAAKRASSPGEENATGGINFDGPATAADNTGLTGQRIDQWIAAEKPGSPLLGMGQYILDYANRKNVSVGVAMGIMLLESQLGSDGSYLPQVNNFGGLTGSGWAGQTGSTSGMARDFAKFATREDGIRAIIDNLGSGLYQGKSVKQQIGRWYLNNPEADMNAKDEQGNASVAQYLATVGRAYQGLGINYNPEGKPTKAASGAGVTGALSTIFAGSSGSIMQEFGRTEYAQANAGVYDYATQMGLPAGAHTGLDIGLPRGSRLYSPVSGTVVTAGGTPYYTDNQGGAGELRIRLDNGEEVILGHMATIGVRVGGRVKPGQLVGTSGGSDGDHLHLEWRVRDGSTPSGWRIVDPRSKLKQ